MAQFYKSYGVQTTDPSKGLMAAQAQQGTNLKSVVDGIESMMKNQEGQIIQANTQQANDLLKQKIQERGLGILSNPLDQEEELRGFGNMVNREAIGKTITSQTDLMKNQYENKISAEADAILQSTGDPIAARNHYNKAMLTAGASAVYADTASVGYDARKAPEVKNNEIQHNQLLEEIKASANYIASQRGYTGGKKEIDDATSLLPAHRQAAARKALTHEYELNSAPNKHDEDTATSTLATFDNETKSLEHTLNEALKQKNNQTYNVSNTSSQTSGTTPRSSRVTKGSSPDLVTKDGKPTESMATILGNNVSNWFEKMSSSSDAAEIHGMYKTALDGIGDSAAASRVLKDVYDAVYKGDRWTGNDLSKTDIKEMKERIHKSVSEYQQTDGGDGGRTSTTSTSSRGGNISYTGPERITAFTEARARERHRLVNELREAGRNNSIGFTGGSSPDSPDAMVKVLQAYLAKPTTTPAAATTGKRPVGNTDGRGNNTRPSDGPINPRYADTPPAGRPGAKARIDTFSANNVGTPVKETPDEELARIMATKNAKVPKQPNQGTAPQATTATSTTSTLTRQERYEQDKANNEALRKLHAARIAENKKPKPKVDPRAGKIRVITSEGKVVNVPADTDLQKFKYRLYSK